MRRPESGGSGELALFSARAKRVRSPLSLSLVHKTKAVLYHIDLLHGTHTLL